jgi:hypothetical protein
MILVCLDGLVPRRPCLAGRLTWNLTVFYSWVNGLAGSLPAESSPHAAAPANYEVNGTDSLSSSHELIDKAASRDLPYPTMFDFT